MNDRVLHVRLISEVFSRRSAVDRPASRMRFRVHRMISWALWKRPAPEALHCISHGRVENNTVEVEKIEKREANEAGYRHAGLGIVIRRPARLIKTGNFGATF